MRRIYEFIFLQIKNLLGSFNNAKDGWSKRALSAFISIATAIYITVHKLPESAQLHALYSWQVFALCCLGLITGSQLIELTSKKNETTPPPAAEGV